MEKTFVLPLKSVSYLLQCSRREPVACHVDDIIRPGHDVKEALLIHKTCIHGVIVTLMVEQRENHTTLKRMRSFI